MKKKIIIVNDDYPSVNKKTIYAADYIINEKYSNINYEAHTFFKDSKYLTSAYYVELMSKARQHEIPVEIKNHTKEKYENRLAILIDPYEENPPTGKESLELMKTVSESIGFKTDIVTYNHFKNSYHLYDALFIRETTAVNHHTYEISKICEEHGLVVIDDSESIRQCTNKIYQNELFKINNIPVLESKIICNDNLVDIAVTLNYPCVVKIPDSCCSMGVFKMESRSEFIERCYDLLLDYKFLLVQEFYKTDFDWRIGILNGKPLFACKYWMSRNGWQIIDHSDPNDDRISKCGRTEIVDIKQVPDYIIKTALKSSALIGNGLYGVDLKEKNQGCIVVEINDCLDIDIPYEIKAADNFILLEIFNEFKNRLEKKKSIS